MITVKLLLAVLREEDPDAEVLVGFPQLNEFGTEIDWIETGTKMAGDGKVILLASGKRASSYEYRTSPTSMATEQMEDES